MLSFKLEVSTCNSFIQVTFSCRCVKCKGRGKIPCATCGSRGLIKCATCNGSGSLLARNIAIIRWYVNLAVSNHTFSNSVPLIDSNEEYNILLKL